MNFCISANSLTKKYECKTTHSATPFLKVDTQYLDLTTKTTSGLNIKVKHNNITYRPLQTATSTSSRSSQYISTSGYSGISSRASTSGYSGVSSKASTSGYKGSLSKVSTSGYSGRSSKSSQYTSTSGYKYGWQVAYYKATGVSCTFNLTRQSSAGIYKHTYGAATGTTKSNTFSTSIYTGGKLTIGKVSGAKGYIVSGALTSCTSYLGNVGNLMAVRNAASLVARTHTNSTAGLTYVIAKNHTATFSIQGTVPKVILSAMGMYTSWITSFMSVIPMTYTYHTGTSAKESKTTSSSKQITSITGSWYTTTTLTKTASRSSAYTTSSTAVGNLTSTTALTRSSAYSASSTAIGNMSSTTALTRASNYSTSATVTGNMSSTTALTKSSAYGTSAANASVLSSTTALTKTASRTSQYEIITEI